MQRRQACKATHSDEEGRETLWNGPRVAAACACAILMTVGLVGVFVHFSASEQQASGSSWLDQQQKPLLSLSEACQQLSGRHRQLCQDYIAAEGEERWSAASAWRRGSPDSFVCSGIDVTCLDKDIKASSTGTSSACRPLPEGAQCSFNRLCKQGLCGGPPSDKTDQLADAASEASKAVQGAADSSRDAASSITIDAAAGLEQDEEGASEAAAGLEQDEEGGSDAAASEHPQQQLGDAAADASDEQEAPSHRMLISAREAVKSNKAVGKWPTAIYSVDTSQLGRRVADTFVATSHEYNRIYDYGGEYIHAWANVFNMLSSSPIIRVGGASQDKMTRVPGPKTWEALKALQERVNARYIFGLPLWQENAVQLSKQIMQLSQQYLAPGAVIGFELGNEPEFWPTGLGGRNEKGEWKDGFDAFAEYFHRVAQQLAPCGSGKRILSGPGWGNVNTQPHNWLAKIMWTGKECGYLWEVNVHYYPYIDNVTVTHEQLLSQQLQDFGLDKYREYQRLADQGWMRLRISETNSLYGGGKAGLSDTMAGMFWVADALCEMAKAGAGGFHLHWGIGGAPDGTQGQPNTGVQTNFFYKVGNERKEYKELKALGVSPAKLPPPVAWPSIHAPWPAYLFWTVLAHGDYNKLADTTFVHAQLDRKQYCSANIKIHALKADNGDLRIALINKDATRNCNARVKVPSQYCKTSALTRLLPGPDGILGKIGITWQGQTYDGAGYEGLIQGQKEVQWVDKRQFKDGKCGFELALPAASAALIISNA